MYGSSSFCYLFGQLHCVILEDTLAFLEADISKSVQRQPPFFGLLFCNFLGPPAADTKRKVEQISEELKTLDEILSKDEGADDDSEKTEEALEEADTQAAGYTSIYIHRFLSLTHPLIYLYRI